MIRIVITLFFIFSTMSMACADVAWWDSGYLFRRQLTVVNNTASTLTTGYTVWAAMPTSSKIIQADGDDLRIVFWNGAAYVELDRHLRYLNSVATEAYFKTQADIAGNSADANYYIYYNNPSASNPPANPSNVYEYWQPFDDLTGWTTQGTSITVTGGIVTIPSGRLLYRDMGYLGTIYNKVFEQYVRADLAGPWSMWWGEQFRIPSGDYCGNQCCDGTYEGYRDLIVVSSTINAAAKNSLVGLATPGAGDDTRSVSWVPGSGYNVYTQKWKANEVKHHHNRALWATHAVDVSANFNVFMEFWNYNSSGSLMVDWVAVRPYVDPEPTVSVSRQEGPATRLGGGTIGSAVIR
jgi:hypothetical protein